MTAEEDRTARTIASGEEALAALLKVGTKMRLTLDVLIEIVGKDSDHERATDDR